MNIGKTVFSQLMDFAPSYEFHKGVAHCHGEYKVQAFSCWNQYLCMAFAQLTYRESLRDIEARLRSVPIKLYHLGIRGTVARNTLAHANAVRNWRIYADFAHVLIQQARALYAGEELAVQLDQTVYALDSTIIDLCLALFPWAKFRRRKAAVKRHTLFDMRAKVPTLVIITHGKVHDVRILDELSFEPGGRYVMDRGYLDFARLHHMQRAGPSLSPAPRKTSGSNAAIPRRAPKPAIKPFCAQRILFPAGIPRPLPAHSLSRYRQRLVFLTNNFTLPAGVIATVYRYRWQVELFFKWIKQHLRIKAFYGTSENAVKTQIWIAISVHVLVAIAKKRLTLEHSLYTILQIPSITLFQKTHILHVFSKVQRESKPCESHNQLILFK